MTESRTTLIIPVESQVRELDAKLLLACVAAERGFRVVLGSRAHVHYKVASIERGIYLAKSMRSLSVTMFRLLRQLGHEIVAWDEEGLVRIPPEDYYRRRLSRDALERVSHLLAWGEDDAEIYRRYPGYPGTPIHITGNPRIDLLRPALRGYFEAEVEEIRRQMGAFVLVNTNFGYVNSFVRSLNLMQKSRKGLVPGANTRGMTPAFARGIAAHKQSLFESFLDLVPRLADAFPESTIVVRPHPSESHEPWRRAAAGRKNVAVVNERSVAPWLIAARALVHNGCTTAVEAAVLATPAIAYRPIADKAYDLELPNALSHEVDRPDDLIDTLRGFARGEKPAGATAAAPALRALLSRHVAALEGTLAADRMISVLCDAGYRDAAPPASPLPRRVWGGLHAGVRTAVKRSRSFAREHRNSSRFHHHRFPGTSVGDLRERIGRLTGELDRFEGLKVWQAWDHIYRIDG